MAAQCGLASSPRLHVQLSLEDRPGLRVESPMVQWVKSQLQVMAAVESAIALQRAGCGDESLAARFAGLECKPRQRRKWQRAGPKVTPATLQRRSDDKSKSFVEVDSCSFMNLQSTARAPQIGKAGRIMHLSRETLAACVTGYTCCTPAPPAGEMERRSTQLD